MAFGALNTEFTVERASRLNKGIDVPRLGRSLGSKDPVDFDLGITMFYAEVVFLLGIDAPRTD
jgi:hypothetical protein